MTTIKSGAVVQLRSGGPRMTVSTVGTTDKGVPTAECVWFDGSERKSGWFLTATVCEVQEDRPESEGQPTRGGRIGNHW